MSRQLGLPLMPWQQLIADVGLEIDPESGLPAYREICLTVPRQSGKTSLLLAWELQRCLRWPTAQRVAFTSQTGWDARRKLVDDQVPLLLGSPLKVAVERIYRGAGNESVIFKNGSRIDVLAATESAGHGRTIDLGVIDEAFADIDYRREQSILPAMATKPAAQILILSTAGTEASVFLKHKVDTGRAAVTSGATNGIAYFEWSADPDADIDDPRTWQSCMPALGLTISEAVVRHARATMSEGDFRRSYLNQWTASDDRIIPAVVWDAVVSPGVKPDGRLVFAVDVAPDRSSASIGVADEQGRVELVESRPGVGWIVDRVVQLSAKFECPVVLDGYGPAGSLFDQLESKGVRVEKYSSRQVAQACSTFFDAVADDRIRVRSSSLLDDAVAAVRRRVSGDTWSWSRSDTAVDICPLMVVTLAFDKATSAKAAGDLWVSWD